MQTHFAGGVVEGDCRVNKTAGVPLAGFRGLLVL
jgi:hypothetical protein